MAPFGSTLGEGQPLKQIINYLFVCLPGADGVCPHPQKGFAANTLFAPARQELIISSLPTHKAMRDKIINTCFPPTLQKNGIAYYFILPSFAKVIHLALFRYSANWRERELL